MCTTHTCLDVSVQVVGEDDRKLQKRLKYLGERMNRRGAQEEGACGARFVVWP